MYEDTKEDIVMKNRRTHRARKMKVVKKIVVLSVVVVALTVIGCLQFGQLSSAAHGNATEDPVFFKYYKSIEIEEGDTLWGIAEEYMGDEYDSVQEYIAELKDINQLVTDDIQSAKYLTVVYYDSEFK